MLGGDSFQAQRSAVGRDCVAKPPRQLPPWTRNAQFTWPGLSSPNKPAIVPVGQALLLPQAVVRHGPKTGRGRRSPNHRYRVLDNVRPLHLAHLARALLRVRTPGRLRATFAYAASDGRFSGKKAAQVG